MAKRTAVIDIGSNSARLVIFQETSQHGFHLICELKSRVRIGEGAYANNGHLQPIGISRAYNALKSFSQTIDEYKATNTLAVATSALRDAPNRNIFLDKVKNKLGIDINVIDGKEEALLGAIAANSLLPVSNNTITIDIGGGSTDMALISNGDIVDRYSLDLGTVRLKELFFDKSKSIDMVKKYISRILTKLPKSFRAKSAVAIGGTSRTLAKGIISRTQYPFNKLHAFQYNYEIHHEFFNEIIKSNIEHLHKLHIKENRFDTIREGTLIFSEICMYLGVENIITSGVGVREGVYLRHRYPEAPYRIPYTINSSIRSIKDRFDLLSLPKGNKLNVAINLYEIISKEFDVDKKYLPVFKHAINLSDTGKILTIYNKDRHASYIAMQELNYGFKHSDMILISILLRSNPKKGYHKEMYRQYKTLLPSKKILKWLSFIYTLTLILNSNSTKAKYKFALKDNVLKIESNKTLYLAFEEIKEMKKRIDIVFV